MATHRICSVEDCGKPRYKREWCNAHYIRWRRHGDPLSGSTPRGDTLGSPAIYFREVVLAYDGDECLTWPFNRDRKGYARVEHNGRMCTASRVVCEYVHGPAPTPKHHAAHNCGNGSLACVTKRHLDWKTPRENEADKLIHGTRARGERQHQSKLTEQQVHTIRSLKDAISQRELSRRFGVNQSTISRILHGTKWGWLTPIS